MQYTEYIPSQQLRDIVKTIWVLEDASAPTNNFEKILPDGCSEMIFHLGEPMLQKEHGQEFRQQQYFIYGQLSKYIELKSLGHVSVIGVKFFPWGLAALTNIPQHQFQGQRIHFCDIFKNDYQFIFERIYEEKTIAGKIDMIQKFLINNRAGIKIRTNQRALQFAIEQLAQSNGIKKISSISSAVNISSRELERKFKRDIGLTPKQIARIYHFQSVLQLKSQAQSLTDLAHAAGYYDQSHFIREFRDIAGISPRDFFNEGQKLTEIFVERKM